MEADNLFFKGNVQIQQEQSRDRLLTTRDSYTVVREFFACKIFRLLIFRVV